MARIAKGAIKDALDRVAEACEEVRVAYREAQDKLDGYTDKVRESRTSTAWEDFLGDLDQHCEDIEEHTVDLLAQLRSL